MAGKSKKFVKKKYIPVLKMHKEITLAYFVTRREKILCGLQNVPGEKRVIALCIFNDDDINLLNVKVSSCYLPHFPRRISHLPKSLRWQPI